jgi:hypothetical protein
MAYLTNTILNDFQAREAQNEKREANYGMLDMAKDCTMHVDYIPPSVRDQLSTISASRLAKIPAMKDQSVTVTTTPGFSNIPVNIGESDTYYFTAYDVFSGFRLFPASYENNQIDGEWWREQTLRNVLKAMAVAKDDIIETVLEARKTQVLAYGTQVSQGEGTFAFDSNTDTLNINKAAQKDTMFVYLNELMRANLLGGDYRIVTSPGGLLASSVEAAKYQQNQDKQLMWAQSALPQDRRYISNQLSPGSDNFTGFICRDGACGIYENWPWDFRNGTEFAGKKWSITDVEMPYIKSRPNIFINTVATEATSIISPSTDSNLIMTHFEEMAIWDRFYVVYRYNSDLATRANDIVKIKGLTS